VVEGNDTRRTSMDKASTWNDLDHYYLNDLIADRLCLLTERDEELYPVACKLAGEMFTGAEDEEELAAIATDAAVRQ